MKEAIFVILHKNEHHDSCFTLVLKHYVIKPGLTIASYTVWMETLFQGYIIGIIGFSLIQLKDSVAKDYSQNGSSPLLTSKLQGETSKRISNLP